MTPRLPFTILMVLAALALALPSAGALAQSAGDNQYQDPLGGSNGSGRKTPSRSSQGGGRSGGGSSSAGSGSAGTAGSKGGGGSAAAAPSPSAGGSRAVPLARTGFDALIPAVAGVLLLAGGGVLLFRTRRTSGT